MYTFKTFINRNEGKSEKLEERNEVSSENEELELDKEMDKGIFTYSWKVLSQNQSHDILILQKWF